MKKGRKLILSLVGTLLLGQAMPVLAAQDTEVSLKAKQDNKNEKQLEVNCYLDGKEEITNGKLRIYYDKDQVKLVSSEAGDILSDGLCEVNDCLSGNKPEGELVAAFASSRSIGKKGNLLEMKFELKDGVEKEDEIKFQVKPEKIAGDQGDISVEEAELNFVVGKSGEQTSGGKNEAADKDDKEQDKDKDKNTSSGSKSNGKVKTGDNAEIIKYVVMGAGTLVVLLVCVRAMTKKEKKNR